MKHSAFALVVHERPEPCESLKAVLRRLGVDTFSVRRCADALRLIEQTHPHLIFTDPQLPDGNWIDLVNLAEGAAIPICVILVGSATDPEMLQVAIRHGAFSFISPPFDDRTVFRQIDRAIALVRSGRERRWGAAVAQSDSAA